jgi:hypothetical protein
VGRAVGRSKLITGAAGSGGGRSSKTAESVKLVGMAGIMAAANIMEALTEGKEAVMEGSKEATGTVVQARYGDEAKEVYTTGVDAVINIQKVGARYRTLSHAICCRVVVRAF